MRKTYLDNIRWITVVLVVIYHVIYMFNGVVTVGVIGPFSDNQPQDLFQYIVYPWFMLLLFVVSGMSARFELDKMDTKEFIRKRTRKLLVPSTLGLLVWGWALGYYNILIGGGMEGVQATPAPIRFIIMCVSGTGVLWYIQLLWFFSLILIFIRKIEKDKLWNLCSKAGVFVVLALTLLIFGTAQILNTPVVVVYRFGIYGAGFLIGYFVFSHDEVMDRLEQKWIILSILGLVSCVLFVVMYWGQPYADHVVLDTFVCNLYAWLGTVGILAFMKKWGGFDNGFSRFMKKESWGLYIFHYLFIAVVAWNLRSNVPEMAPALVYLLVAIAAFSGSYIFDAVISRIPVLRWFILGEKSLKAKKQVSPES